MEPDTLSPTFTITHYLRGPERRSNCCLKTFLIESRSHVYKSEILIILSSALYKRIAQSV